MARLFLYLARKRSYKRTALVVECPGDIQVYCSDWLIRVLAASPLKFATLRIMASA
jgi:hypothetical protein